MIPAAGASSRMRGADKLLEDVGGVPCLRALVDRAQLAGADVVVTLPSLAHPRAEALKGSGATLVPVPNAALGLAQSLKIGVRAVPAHASGVMILPADMPDIQSRDMELMWHIFERDAPPILRAVTPEGHSGHPVIVVPDVLTEFEGLQGDTGAQSLIKARSADVMTIVVQGARCDLDTPEEWAAWRKSDG